MADAYDLLFGAAIVVVIMIWYHYYQPATAATTAKTALATTITTPTTRIAVVSPAPASASAVNNPTPVAVSPVTIVTPATATSPATATAGVISTPVVAASATTAASVAKWYRMNNMNLISGMVQPRGNSSDGGVKYLGGFTDQTTCENACGAQPWCNGYTWVDGTGGAYANQCYGLTGGSGNSVPNSPGDWSGILNSLATPQTIALLNTGFNTTATSFTPAQLAIFATMNSTPAAPAPAVAYTRKNNISIIPMSNGNVNYDAGTVMQIGGPTDQASCETACTNTQYCQAYTWVDGTGGANANQCFSINNKTEPQVASPGYWSGIAN